MKLRRGVIIHPTIAKSDGKRRVRPKLHRVRRTPWTIPNVMRSA
jgi:hypothetical protein